MTVVTRKEFDTQLRNKELSYQYSAEVDDKSAASLGKTLGVQTIIIGSFTPEGGAFRMRIRAVDVETATLKLAPPSEIVSLPVHLKPAAAKIGAGFLNIAGGLGSYLNGDLAGGITLSAGYALAAALFIIEAAVLDWDSPAVGVPATIGAACAGLTLVYGFVRPFMNTSARKHPSSSLSLPRDRLSVTPFVFPRNGNQHTGIRFLYTHTL